MWKGWRPWSKAGSDLDGVFIHDGDPQAAKPTAEAYRRCAIFTCLGQGRGPHGSGIHHGPDWAYQRTRVVLTYAGHRTLAFRPRVDGAITAVVTQLGVDIRNAVSNSRQWTPICTRWLEQPHARDAAAGGASAAQAAIEKIRPEAKNLLTIPENHTRNQHYLSNAAQLRRIFYMAG